MLKIFKIQVNMKKKMESRHTDEIYIYKLQNSQCDDAEENQKFYLAFYQLRHGRENILQKGLIEENKGKFNVKVKENKHINRQEKQMLKGTVEASSSLTAFYLHTTPFSVSPFDTNSICIEKLATNTSL